MARNSSSEMFCVRCNTLLPSSDFYKSPNERLHRSGLIPYCKSCMKKITSDYLKEYNNMQSALFYACATADIPFIQKVYTHMEDKMKQKTDKIGNSKLNYFGNYMVSFNMLKTDVDNWHEFGDSDTKLDNIQNTSEIKERIAEEITKFKLDWGEFETKDDYAFLEYRYDIYTDGMALTPAQETLYRKLCIAELKSRKIEAAGENSKDIQKQILDLMSKLKIDNFAEVKDKDLVEQLLESQIALHEQQEPMEFYDQKELYEDVCGLGNGWERIKRGLLNFCLGHKDYPKVTKDGVIDG